MKNATPSILLSLTILALAACGGRTEVPCDSTSDSDDPTATDGSGSGGTGAPGSSSTGGSSGSSSTTTSTTTDSTTDSSSGSGTGGGTGGECAPIPDALACLRGWHCIAACSIGPAGDYDETMTCAQDCAVLHGATAEDPGQATSLLLAWLDFLDSQCMGDQACLHQGISPQMGTGEYLSTCLNG